MRPTPRGLIVAAIGFVVALLPSLLHERLWTFWPMYLGAMGMAFGVDLLLGISRRRVTCEVECPELLYIGEKVAATLNIKIPTAREVPVQAAVDLSEDLVPQALQRGRASRRGSRIRFRLQPTRRGTAVIERVWIRYTGPLGFLYRTMKVELKKRIAVVPNIRPVKTTALRFFIERDFRAGLKIEKYTGDGTEFDSLREYHKGDDNRAIDWKSTARHRKLVARQFRAERNHQIIISIDTGHLMSEAVEEVPKLDHAINATLLLSYLSLKSGDRVGLFTFGPRVGLFLDPQGGMKAHKMITRFTSEVEYSHEETNFTLGLTALAARLRRRSLVVVMTDFVDTVTAELMAENLNRLARRHLIIFVSLKDPDLVAIAGQAPATPVRLNQAVVAENLLRAREVVVRKLQRQGIYAIDAEPKHVNAQLINAYLDIKRRERI